MAGFTLSLSLTGTATLTPIPDEGEPTLEPNVWPQPDFDASTGLTLQDVDIASGEMAMGLYENGEQFCAMAAPPTFTQGEVWHYAVGVVAAPPGAGFVFLQIGGQAVDMYEAGGAPYTKTGSVTIGASPTQQLRFYEATGFRGLAATSCSIQREA